MLAAMPCACWQAGGNVPPVNPRASHRNDTPRFSGEEEGNPVGEATKQTETCIGLAAMEVPWDDLADVAIGLAPLARSGIIMGHPIA